MAGDLLFWPMWSIRAFEVHSLTLTSDAISSFFNENCCFCHVKKTHFSVRELATFMTQNSATFELNGPIFDEFLNHFFVHFCRFS